MTAGEQKKVMIQRRKGGGEVKEGLGGLVDLVDGRLVLGLEAEVDGGEDDHDEEGVEVAVEDILQPMQVVH